MQCPIGERVLPLEYVKMYFKRKENLSWEQMYIAANEEYKMNQQKQLNRIAEKEQLKAEAAEAARKAKEEEKRVQREKEEAEERKRKEEEERKRQLQREQEEKERQIRLKQEQEAADEARKEVKSFLLGDLIELSEEDEAPEPANPNKITPAKIKKELVSPRKSPIQKPDKQTEPTEDKKQGEIIDSSNIKKEKTDNLGVSPHTHSPVKPDSILKPNDTDKSEPPEKADMNIQQKIVLSSQPTAKETNPNKQPDSEMDHDQILAEIGTLIVDPDVINGLCYMKSLGQTIREGRPPTQPVHVPNPNRRIGLFQEFEGTLLPNLKQEQDTSGKIFASPPAGVKKFFGMK